MRPIPVAFHIWFIEVHTYGIGLAITFWFGLRYTERRLRNAGYDWQWVTGMFLWVIAAAIIGARIMSVIPNWSQYSDHPLQVFAIWQGGLSSFGGLLLAVPVGIISSRRRCPSISTIRFLDLMAPVLLASWGIGRLLGPQLMIRGGGHPTSQWFGMYYAGEVGKHLPVPIFQAAMDLSIFGILLLTERWLRTHAPAMPEPAGPSAIRAGALMEGDVADDNVNTQQRDQGALGPPAGILIGAAMIFWGIERFLDEHLWLGPGHLGFILVQLAGIALALAGMIVLATRYPAFKKWRKGGPAEHAPGDAQRTLTPSAPTSLTSSSSG